MSIANEILDEPLIRLIPYISAKTLILVSKLEKKQPVAKSFKTVRDLVECDIEEVKSLLIYKVGREYQTVLFEIEEGLALAGLKIKNSDFTPYDIRYERLKFSASIIQKLKKAFPTAKTAGDISILGTRRLIRAGITHQDISRHITKVMQSYNMVIESDKKSVLRHSTYDKPATNSKKTRQSSRVTTSKKQNEEVQNMQLEARSDSSIQVYKLGPDEEIKDGKIVKKEKPMDIKKQTVFTNSQIETPKTEFSKITLHKPDSIATNQSILNMTIEEFGFSKRTIDGLHKIQKIKTIGDLANYGKNRLKTSIGIGPGAILEIEVLLFKHGIALRESQCFKKGEFRSYGKNAIIITAEEIKNSSLSELREKVSDQRHLGNYRPKKKTVPTETSAEIKPQIEPKIEPESTAISVGSELEKPIKSTIKQKQKRVRKANLSGEQKSSSKVEPEKDLPKIEIKNLAPALKQYGIRVLEEVDALSFAENNSDFDEIKIAVNNYFSEKIASTVEVASSLTSLDKMKQQIFDEMADYEKIVIKKREIVSRLQLDIKRKKTSIILRNSLNSLMNKFYHNLPSSGLISGNRVKLHTFTSPLIMSENIFEQREL